MPDAALTVKFGADTQGAVAGIDQVKARLQSLYAQMDAAKDRQALLMNPANIRAAQKQIDNIGKQIDALGNNQGFGKLAASAQSSLKPMNDAYSTIRKIAYILPGVGIGAIFGAAFEAIGAAISSLSAASNEAEKAQQGLNKALGEGSAKVQGEIAELTDLSAIALDTSNSTKTRGEAFSKLQALYPGYLSNLSIEKSSYQDIQVALDKVTSALVRQAQIKGLEGAIVDIYKDLNKTIAEGGTGFERLQNKVVGTFGALNLFGKGDIFQRYKDFAKTSQDLNTQTDTKNAQNQIDALNAKLKELLKTSLEQGDDLLKVKPEKAKAAADVLQLEISALEKLNQLQLQSDKVDSRPLFKQLADSVNDNAALLLRDKIAITIRDNARDGIKQSITDQEVKLLQDQLTKLLNPDLTSNIDTHVVVRSNIAKEIQKFKEDTGKTLDERLGKNTPAIKTDIKVDPNLIFDEFGRSAAQFSKSVDKISKQFTDILNESLTSAIEAVSMNLVGGSLAGLFSDLENIIGQGLEQLGKSLLLTFPIIQAAKTAIANAIYDPQLIAIAGVLAIAAGAAIKGLAAKKGIHAFAEGGIVTGPTNALIGEAGPEVIFPLDKLNRFIKNNTGSQSMNINVAGEISGDTLRLLLARSNKNHSYVG